MFAENLSQFFSDFGAESVTVAGVAVKGIFDNGHQLGAVGEYGIATSQPRLTLPTASVPADPIGQPCTIGTTSYVVAEHHPDGTGVSVLLLEVAV